MKRKALSSRLSAIILVAILAASGCTLWPSNWRPFGSPLDKNERAQKKLDAAQDAAIGAAQSAVHKANTALASAPQDDRAVTVARDFVAEAQALLDQAHGAPAATDEAHWRELVAGLLSENKDVRAAAEREHAADASTIEHLSDRLSRATASAQRSNTQALEYARDREALADWAAKLKLGFFAIIGLFLLGTLLSVAARFFPAFGAAAKIVNGVIAPGITYAAKRAEDGLRNVGKGIANLRKAGAITEAAIEQHLDGVTDADHQQLILAGAAAAGAPPPQEQPLAA